MDHDAIGYSYVETHGTYSIPLNYYKVESDEAKSCEFLTGGIFVLFFTRRFKSKLFLSEIVRLEVFALRSSNTFLSFLENVYVEAFNWPGWLPGFALQKSSVAFH